MNNLEKTQRVTDEIISLLEFNIMISETASTWREFTSIEIFNLLHRACQESLLSWESEKCYVRLKERIGYHIIRHSDGAVQKCDLIDDTNKMLKKLKSRQKLFMIKVKEEKGEIDESM